RVHKTETNNKPTIYYRALTTNKQYTHKQLGVHTLQSNSFPSLSALPAGRPWPSNSSWRSLEKQSLILLRMVQVLMISPAWRVDEVVGIPVTSPQIRSEEHTS